MSEQNATSHRITVDLQNTGDDLEAIRALYGCDKAEAIRKALRLAGRLAKLETQAKAGGRTHVVISATFNSDDPTGTKGRVERELYVI